MYELLLDKKARLFFTLYRQMKCNNRQSMAVVTKELAVSQWSVMRLIRQYQSTGQHLRLGMDILRREGHLYLLTRKDFDERQLFSYLLEESLVLQLLQILWHHSSFTVADLAKTVFHNPATVRQALREIQPLLAQYHIDIQLGKPPLLRGQEAELRFFYLHLQFLTAGKEFQFDPSVFNEWQKMGATRDAQGLQVKETWFCRNQVAQMIQLPAYQFSEKGFGFLWKQLLGVETIWTEPYFEELIPHLWVRKLGVKKKELYDELYRLHLLAWLFPGDLRLSLTKSSEKIEKSQSLEKIFHKNLPGYQQLLAKHPELPACHEQILRKYQLQSKQRWLSFSLAEESISISQTGSVAKN